jgi:hypothetical protein
MLKCLWEVAIPAGSKRLGHSFGHAEKMKHFCADYGNQEEISYEKENR